MGLSLKIKPLTDTDPMPWGKHKGEPMSDIPEGYLFWCWDEAGMGKKNDKLCPVANYIRANLEALKMENTDRIWT